MGGTHTNSLFGHNRDQLFLTKIVLGSLRMNPATNPSQVLQTAKADHEILSKAIKNFRRVFVGDRPPDAAQHFAAIQHLLTQKIVEHLTDEETRVFPALLASPRGSTVAPVVTELIQEHIQLLAEAQRLSGLLQQQSIPQSTGKLWTALLDYFTVFEKHVIKEDLVFKSFS